MAAPELGVILDVVGIAAAGVLAIVSLLLLYPLWAYARNVAYTEGFVMLATAFFLVTIIQTLEVVFAMDLLADVLRVPAAFAALLGNWFFARDFVDVGGDDVFFDNRTGGDGDGDG